MKKEFDISCSIYQEEGEIRHQRRENQMAKVMAKNCNRKKQAVKGYAMRAMVRAATGIEGAKRN